MYKLGFAVALALAVAGSTGCAGRQPTSQQQQLSLQQEADAALNTMTMRDASLSGVLQNADAYAVFPDVGQAGAIVGGAHGRGVLYKHGRSVGEVTLTQGSVGFQLGAQTFAELLVLTDPLQTAALETGQFTLGAGVTAVAIKPGIAAGTRFENGEGIFIMPRGGLMAGIEVNGQQIQYEPYAG